MLIGLAGTENESITCPSGYTMQAANVAGQDQVWCQGPNGERIEVQSADATGSSSSGGIGVLGWCCIVGGTLVAVSLFLRK